MNRRARKQETMVRDHDDRIGLRRRAPVGLMAAIGLLLAGAARAEDAAAPAPATTTTPTPTPATTAPAPAADPVVAQRGDISLTASQLRDLIRFSTPEQRQLLQTNPTALQQAVRDRLLKLALLAQAAIASSWIEAQVPDDPDFPNDAQVQAAYDANKTKFVVPRQFHVAQIFLALPPGAGKAAEDEALRKLNDLRQQVTRQHADFAALAKRYSDEKESSVNGGDLGWVRGDSLVPPIRVVVQGLTEGAVSDPVRGPNGWHLLKLVGIKPPTVATLPEVRETLVKLMRQERQVEAQRLYLANMLKTKPVELNEIELSKFITK
jgi:peptidylprolyl isomerase